jgi:hypothetical protein
MANTLIPIQTYTLSGNTASVTFSNIPQNYTDLKLVVSARQDNTDNNLIFKPNGATTSITTRMLTGDGASASSNTSTTPYGLVGQTGFTSNTFGSTEWYIPNYTSANFKSWSVDECNENNGTTAYARLQAGLWSSTAAITSIVFTAGSSGNFVANSTFTLYGISNGVKATGGTLTVAGGYAYHTFTSTGSFLPNQQIKGAEVLAVAGGGAGGTNYGAGGGGGAGGVLYANSVNLNAGNTYTALVGAGASTQGALNTASTSGNGSNSVFSSVNAIGGGGGASYNATPGNGGSGGGGGGADSATTGGLGTVGQGNNGGNTTLNQYAAAGGGGAGAAGGSNGGGPSGGSGGIGTSVYSDWHAITGTGVLSGGYYYVAGGGGGGAGNPSNPFGGYPGAGGIGGGSAGQSGSSNASNATANTGGGGGGIRQGTVSGNGGSGLIIVRYRLD